MFVKSRKYGKQQDLRFPPYPLSDCRQAINETVTEYAILSAIFLVLTLGSLAFYLFENNFLTKADDQMSPLFITATSLLIFLISFPQFLRSFRVGQELKKFTYASEESVFIHCRSVSFLFRMQKPLSLIVCIIIKGERGNRFYYVYPLKNAPYETAAKDIEKALAHKDLTLTCYKGTRIIKSIPKEP